MTDEELRTLVRGAIARHLGSSAPLTAPPPPENPRPAADSFPWRAHPSFGKFLVAPQGDDGRCIIEPAVECNHCGYCQSYGH